MVETPHVAMDAKLIDQIQWVVSVTAFKGPALMLQAWDAPHTTPTVPPAGG